MNTITPPEIPQQQVEFAKAVAKIATEHGIDNFTMSYRPDREQRQAASGHRHSDLKIQFSSVDGRGRPCQNLSINLEASLKLVIKSTPQSCS